MQEPEPFGESGPELGRPGIYVMMAGDPKHSSIFRFGKKEDCVSRRMRQHGGPKGKYDNMTGDFMPFVQVCGWSLPGWPPHRVAMAEQAMFGALRQQNSDKYMSPQRGARNGSIYVVGPEFDWAKFKSRVASELRTLFTLGE